uniref:Uncharacterized protein n=1 Tax=Tohsystermes virus TaxID=2796635 RepID=A0A7T7K8U3_9VIRU|nr:hypothetical protein 3 [Tohsystermes virus]
MTAVFAPLSDKRHSGTFLFMLILTVGAVFLHQSDSKNSWLSKTGKSLSDTVLLKPIGDFVTNNTDKVVGLVLLVPSVVSLPQSIRFGSGRGNGISSPSPYVVFMIFSLPILWLKAYAIFDYSVYSFGVFLLLHLHSNLHRLFVVLIVFVVWTMSKPVK